MTISITKPTVGGSENTWGSTVNTALDDVVDVLNGNTASTPDLTEGSWKVGGTAVTVSAAEINKLDGLTASTAELNKMDGVTATTAELNHTDGVSSNIQTQLNGKASTSTSISAGGGLTGGGSLASNRTISHSDTSSQGSVNNSGTTVVQDISLDTYGHVTSIGSTTIPTPIGGPNYTSPSFGYRSSDGTVTTAGSGGMYGEYKFNVPNNAGSGTISVTGTGSFITCTSGANGSSTNVSPSSTSSRTTSLSLSALQLAGGSFYLGPNGSLSIDVNSSGRANVSTIGFAL